MLSVARFALGLGVTAAVVACLAISARTVRTTLLGWTGPHALVADAVVGLAVLTTVAQLLGAVGQLRSATVATGVVGASSLLVLATRRVGGTAPSSPPVEPSSAPGGEVVAALLGAGVVVVQWATHVGDAIDRGMVYSDTLWYHQPFAARFVQHHSFDVLDGVGLQAARLYPLGSPLVHALGMLAFDRDILSPFVNVAWLALCLAAAWSIGRRSRSGHLCVLGAATVVGLPILAATQPGQASSDIGALALLLCAVALVLDHGGSAPRLAVAGLALGLGVSMKITVAVPAAVIAAGVLVTCWRDRRRCLAWVGGVAATGTFWFVRNWWVTGSPLPWFDLHLGPLHLRAHRGAEAAASGEPPLISSIADGDSWRDIYVPGLWHSFGRVWPLVLAVAVVATLAVAVRGSTSVVRITGIAGVLGLVAYVVTPYTGRLNFASGLRFLAPLLILGFVLAPTVLPTTPRWRRAQLGLLCTLVAVSASMPTFERVPTWPSGAAALTMAAVVVAAVGAMSLRRGRARRVVVSLAPVVLVVGGWLAQDAYLRNRYVDAGVPNDAINEYFRSVRGSRVAVFGTDDTYPMFGLDLSNDVRRGDDPPFDPGTDPCQTWRTRLGGSDYVAIAGSPDALGFYPAPPVEVFDDPAAELVFADRDDLVYRLEGAFTAVDC